MLNHNCKNKYNFENTTIKMRKYLTKFSRIFECGAGSQGVKVCNLLNLVDLVKKLSNEYFLEHFGVDTAENGPLRVCKELARS